VTRAGLSRAEKEQEDTTMAKYKILYQSSTVIDSLPGYKEGIMERINAIKGDEFEYVPCGVERGSLDLAYGYFSFLNDAQFMENLIQAEKKGFDGIVYGCFNDPMLTEAREVLDIPVIGLQQTGMLWAQIYGAKAAIVTFDPLLCHKRFEENIRKYGMEHLMTPIIAFDAPLESGLEDDGRFLEEFDKACQRAVEMGADVILPGCGLLNVAAQKAGYTRVSNSGALVLDSMGCAIKTVEAAVILKEKSGMMTSRSGLYAKPTPEQMAKNRLLYDSSYTYDRKEVLKKCATQILAAKEFGLNTFVDATPSDLARDPELFKAIQEETGVHVICATGLYTEAEGNSAFWRLLNAYKGYDEALKRLTESYIHDISVGMCSSDVKCGLLKLSVGKGYITINLRLIRTLL